MGQSKRTLKENEQRMRTVRIPYVEGLSHEARRIVWKAGIRCLFYAKQTLRGVNSAKDKLPKEKMRNVVYSVKCGTCGGEYIGETQRALGVRKKEHCDAIRLGRTEKSAIAEHVHSTVEGQDMNWESFCIIDGASWKRERKIREALHIGKRKPSVNIDSGIERSMVWGAIRGDV